MIMKINSIRLATVALALGLTLVPVGANFPALAQNKRSSGPAVKTVRGTKPMNSEIKVLAEGQRAGFDKAFVGVAYDAETYTAIRSLSELAPAVDAAVFKTSAVVAVFLGQRPTGGYSVKINPLAAGGIQITETKPAPGTMVAQVLSSPFKVVAVPLAAGKPMTVELQIDTNVHADTYYVESGDFSFAGGIAGRQTKFGLTGGLSFFRREKVVSVWLRLKSVDANKPRAVNTIATGVEDAQGKMTFARVDPGTLIDFPYAPLRAEAAWVDHKLRVEFNSVTPTVADGYVGKGSLRAQPVLEK
jgi:hypothetical protein